MAHKWSAAVVAALLLGSCGGDSGGGGGTGTGGGSSGGTTVTPTPSPSATSPAYPTIAQLTGDQTFKTGCAALRMDSTPYLGFPVTAFGTGLTLSYASASDSYTVSSDGTIPLGSSITFTPADRDANAPAPVRGYRKTVNGFVESLSLGVITPGGTTPDYVRGFGLRAPLFGEARQGAPAMQASCIYGVPTLVTDKPAATQVVFTRIGVNGVAYVTGGNAAPEAYSLAPSVATFSVDLVNLRVTTTIQLTGILQTANGPVSTTTDFGTYRATVDLDERGFYNGLLERTDSGAQRMSSFGGWFFGPQGREAAFAVSIGGQAGTTNREVTAIANVVALR